MYIGPKIKSGDYAGFYHGQLSGRRRADDEGRRYLLSEQNVVRLFETGRSQLEGLVHTEKTLPIAVDGAPLLAEEPNAAGLHNSSLYRMLRIGEYLDFLKLPS
jgi:hypothetical protein